MPCATSGTRTACGTAATPKSKDIDLRRGRATAPSTTVGARASRRAASCSTCPFFERGPARYHREARARLGARGDLRGEQNVKLSNPATPSSSTAAASPSWQAATATGAALPPALRPASTPPACPSSASTTSPSLVWDLMDARPFNDYGHALVHARRALRLTTSPSSTTALLQPLAEACAEATSLRVHAHGATAEGDPRNRQPCQSNRALLENVWRLTLKRLG